MAYRLSRVRSPPTFVIVFVALTRVSRFSRRFCGVAALLVFAIPRPISSLFVLVCACSCKTKFPSFLSLRSQSARRRCPSAEGDLRLNHVLVLNRSRAQGSGLQGAALDAHSFHPQHQRTLANSSDCPIPSFPSHATRTHGLVHFNVSAKYRHYVYWMESSSSREFVGCSFRRAPCGSRLSHPPLIGNLVGPSNWLRKKTSTQGWSAFASPTG